MLTAPIHNFEFYKSTANQKLKWLYLLLLMLIIFTLISLPYIYVDISVKSAGIIRPANERTEIKPAISGIIDTIHYRDGDTVQKGNVILRIKDLNTKSKRVFNRFEITQRQQCIHDLLLLTAGNLTETLVAQLQSPLYKEQLTRFLLQKNEQEIVAAKADKEVMINTPLAKDKVISTKEFYDIEHNRQKIQASAKVFIQSQLSNWQQELARYRSELSQFQDQLSQVNTAAAYYEIKASVSGTVQGINSHYPGGMLQAGETVCTISPDGTLVGECFVQTKDVGLLKTLQPVRYQVDAFNYTYFGVFTGKVVSIDNDFTVVDNKPLFRVRCSFDSIQLSLKNGFTAQLKKGLGFQANFLVARRSLSQLLFDNLDDWLNPGAPAHTITSRIEKPH